MDCRDKPTAVRLEKIGCRSGPAGLVRVFAIGFLEAASALWPGEREGIAAIYASAGPTAPLFASMTARVDSPALRSEEHTSELQSLMRISYDVFCLKKKIFINLSAAVQHYDL